MTVIHNHTGVPYFWFEKCGATGEPLDVLVVRATFDFASHGEVVTLAETQTPIAYGDQFAGPVEANPLRAVLADDGDLLPYKPGTDVLVFGHAQSPDAKPHCEWLAGIQIGPVRKLLKLHGPRRWHKQGEAWRLEEAAPVTSVPLDYRLAYGGSIKIPRELMQAEQPGVVKHDANPAGCGWLPGDAALEQLPQAARDSVDRLVQRVTTLQAPQILAPEAVLLDPRQDTAADGFGPLARWWAPRVGFQGCYDEAWRANRYPLLPADFDSRYYQNAAPDRVATPHLRGDEVATLIGLMPEHVYMRLPGWRIIAAIRHTNGGYSGSLPLLDTVRFHLDSQQLTLVWRTHFDRSNPIAEISLAATTQAVVTDTPPNQHQHVHA